MINVSNQVYAKFVKAVKAYSDKISVSGEYQRVPAKYPFASCEEIENVPYHFTRDSSKKEKYAAVTYRVQVFSSSEGKKEEARKIFAVADEALRGAGLERVTFSTVPDQYDSTVYSIMATYEAVVSDSHVFYKRQTF